MACNKNHIFIAANFQIIYYNERLSLRHKLQVKHDIICFQQPLTSNGVISQVYPFRRNVF